MIRTTIDSRRRDSSVHSSIRPPSKPRIGKRFNRLKSKDAQENQTAHCVSRQKIAPNAAKSKPANGPAAQRSHSSKKEIMRPETSIRAPVKSMENPRHGIPNHFAASRCPHSCKSAAKSVIRQKPEGSKRSTATATTPRSEKRIPKNPFLLFSIFSPPQKLIDRGYARKKEDIPQKNRFGLYKTSCIFSFYVLE